MKAGKNHIIDENKSRKYIQESIRCPKCDSVFKHVNHLDDHNKVVHDGSLLKCDECDFEADNRTTIWYHKRSLHKGTYFKCRQCDFETTHGGALEKHETLKHNPQKVDQTSSQYI